MTNLKYLLADLRCHRGSAILAPARPDLTYQQLADLIAETASALQAAGFQRTDRIALILQNGPEAATAFLAIASVCACAPLNPAYREAELEFYLNDLRPRAIVVAEDGPATHVASKLGIEVIRLTASSENPAGMFRLNGWNSAAIADSEPPTLTDVALLLHTSGTTSRPKLVPLTWENLSQSAVNISNTLQLTPGDRCLNVMPLFHVHGLIAAVLASLSRGASVICSPGFLAPSFFEWLDKLVPTWYTAVPAMHQSVLARARSHPETVVRGQLRFIRSSSAALPVRVLEDLEATFGVPVIEAYGMTEAAHQMACNPLPPLQRKPGSVGVAAGPKVSVRDDSGEEVPRGTPGNVCIAGRNVTAGYVENPKANLESFIGGWFYTGDLGWMDQDGYLFLTGRSKEIINRGGEKISPREVDEVLMTHPSVHQCLAFALPDSRLGEEVGAVVVLKPGAEPDESAIQTFSGSQLADFKVPRRIYFLDDIPKGPTGKLQRIGLAAQLGITEDSWKRAATRTAAYDPAVAARICSIMANVLGLESLDPETSFFEAGGDSLLGTRLIARLGNEFGRACTLVDMFQAPTAAALSSHLSRDAAISPEEPAELVPDHQPELTLSFGQANLWFLDAMEGGSLPYHRPLLIEMCGEIDRDRLQAALVRIVERHEPLRTVVRNRGGNPSPELLSAEMFSLKARDWHENANEGEVMEACRREAAQSFRIDSDLPIRATLHRLESQRSWLLIAFHHIATDAISDNILLRELDALLRGETLDPQPPITYSDYARWQQRLLSGERWNPLLSYWRGQLEGAPEVLQLPIDFPRPARQTFHGKLVSATLPPDLVARLRELSRECGTTLFMTLLAGWKSLLARLSGEDDVCVGVPFSGRTRVEWEPLIGLFMNTLPLRSKLDGDPTFRELLGRVRDTCLRAWSHEDLPFEKLVEALHPKRSPSYTPYFQVIFQLRTDSQWKDQAGPVALRPLDIHLDAVPVDLNFEVTETDHGASCRLFYNTALFTEQSATRLLERFEVLIRGAAEAPETRLATLPLLPDTERSLIMERWNAAVAEYPGESCVHELFEQQAARTPDAVAATFGATELTYSELNCRANQMAHYLVNAGVGPEVCVGIAVQRSLEMLISVIGVLKAGGAYVPLDPAYPAERLAFMIRDSQLTAVITNTAVCESLPNCEARIILLDAATQEIASRPVTNLPARAGIHNLAYIIYTSGSTGRPKGVLLTHSGIGNMVLAQIRTFDLRPADRVLQFASLSFDISVAEVWMALLSGASLHLVALDELLPGPPLTQTLRSKGITILTIAPSLLSTMNPFDVLQLRVLCVGGEACSADVADRWAPGRLMINGYGPTEATDFVIGGKCIAGSGTPPIGKPIPNVQVYILDAHRQPVPVGVRGEIHIGGPGLARGYLNQPELTAERFIDNPFSPGSRLYRTGDLGSYRSDGVIQYHGRIDHQVKIRGLRIENGEIENVLREIPSIRQAVVIAREDRPGENRLVAYVVPEDQTSGLSITEIREALKQKLPDYMVPSAFVTMPSLPQTPSGKIDRTALPAPETTQANSLHSRVAPRTVTEMILVEIWQEILGLKEIGTGDNFFELGGHSLLVVQLVGQIRSRLDRTLPLGVIFQNPTIAAQAALIKTEAYATTQAHLIPLQPGTAAGTIYFVDAGIELARLAHLVREGPAAYGTIVPLTQSAVRAAARGDTNRLPTVEELAAEHTALILSQQHSSPCILVGHSFGGILAFEIAHQLERHGRQVDRIVLLDSWAQMPQWWRKLKLLTPDRALRSLKSRASNLRSRFWPSRVDVDFPAALDSPAGIPSDGEEQYLPFGVVPGPLWKMLRVHARQTYRFRPLDNSRAIVFRAQNSDFESFYSIDETLGWTGLFKNGIELIETPGDHLSLLAEPNLTMLARRFQERVNEFSKNHSRQNR